MGDYRIEVRVEHRTRDEAIAAFKKEIASLEAGSWKETFFTSCTFDGQSKHISISERPLSVEERLQRIERAMNSRSS